MSSEPRFLRTVRAIETMADDDKSPNGAASPKNTVTLTIDGREVTVPEGSTVIQAAQKLGIDIPHYCYHPGLSVAGNCRICVVELVGGRGNPFQISCNTPASAGMEVKTNSEAVLERRANVMEFLLVNHPLDCPICDQAGECMLQIYYMEHDKQQSRVEVNKVNKKKVVPVGPRVMLDQERCILCTRCVRFLDEVTETGELCVVNRGDHSELTNFPGREVENAYSENIVDLCPVGALTSRLFRFQARAWFLKGVDTVCPKCATGCNVRVDYYHHPVVDFNNGKAYRLVPRFNEAVNGHWMCDDGRLAFTDVNEDRAHKALLRENREGELTPAKYDDALASAVERITEVRDGVGSGAIAGIGSPDATLEELFAFKNLVQKTLGSVEFGIVSPRPEGESDDFLRSAEKYPNGRGARLLGLGRSMDELLEACESGKIKALLLLQTSLLDEDQTIAKAWAQALTKVDHVIVIGSRVDKTASAADVVLPSVSFIEKGGTYINTKGRIQRIHRGPQPFGRSKPDLEVLGDLSVGLGTDVGSTDSGAVFERLCEEFPILQGVTYEEIGTEGTQVAELAASSGTESIAAGGAS